MGKRLLSAEMTQALLKAQIATSLEAPYTHYGHGVWIDRREKDNRKFFVVGSDPGVAFRSTFYVEEGIVLTAIGNTGGALWPLYKEIETLLGL